MLLAETFDQMMAALGLEQSPAACWILRLLLQQRVRRFVEKIYQFDQIVGTLGLQAGCQHVMQTYIRRLEVSGQEHVPATGPLLLVSNHPGMYDTPAALAHLSRPDVKVIAAERPFWEALPNVSRLMLHVTDTPMGRMRLIRDAARHLRDGGTILNYPAGFIEADPAYYVEALDTLDQWSESIGLFTRMVPNVAVQPVIISGVFNPAFLKHPLVTLRRDQRDRRWLAATLQFVRSSMQDITIQVAFGRPVYANENGDGAAHVTRAVLEQAHTLITRARRTAQCVQ
ncbi:MAG: glycerol acyltransferase [Chloroflexaceae bacterium]|nr:glycerol acyltransferase [Chloroflexaceae bacterium]